MLFVRISKVMIGGLILKVNESSSKIIYPSKRIDWIDISKGVLIALNVL